MVKFQGTFENINLAIDQIANPCIEISVHFKYITLVFLVFTNRF